MKGITHLAIAAAVPLATGAYPHLIGWAGLLIGATLPDIDLRLGWPHRGITHWPYWPLAALLAGHFLGWGWLFWLGVGLATHYLADALNANGVPFPPFLKKRFCILPREIAVKSENLVEMIMAAALIGFVVIAAASRLGLDVRPLLRRWLGG